MGKTADYKGTTPDGYGEQIAYVDGDSKVKLQSGKLAKSKISKQWARN